MNAGFADGLLSALFIDYDNIYLSLRYRNEEAASRFAKNPMSWFSQLLNGRLIKSADRRTVRRRIAVARCYGNPQPWRLGRNGPEDPNCFAYVRHNFMRAGMEVVDCPKVTSQFKNASDIRIACDIRDYLDHRVQFDEFIILSGNSDFTPVLMNLRSNDRRRAIYTNEFTSPYYRAFCDGWVEEGDLINHLLQSENLIASDPTPPALSYDGGQEGGRELGRELLPVLAPVAPVLASKAPAPALENPKRRPAYQADTAVQSLIADFKVVSDEIMALVVEVVENSHKPVPLAYLADRAQKVIGQPKTLGTNWAGSGGFLSFLTQNLPPQLKISDKPPQVVYNPAKHALRDDAPAPAQPPARVKAAPAAVAVPAPAPAAQASSSEKIADLQRSITRIYEACQAPPLPPSEYQLLFTLIASEVRENGFQPGETAGAIVARAGDAGLNLAMKDVSFVLEAVDEIDPWLERTQSAAAVARAYRDYVLDRCKSSGLHLSDDEHQLIQVWFGASSWGQGAPAASSETPASRPSRKGGDGGASAPERERIAPSFGNSSNSSRPRMADSREAASRYGAPANGRAAAVAERTDIPMPPDFGYADNEQEGPLDLGMLTALRYNTLKRS